MQGEQFYVVTALASVFACIITATLLLSLSKEKLTTDNRLNDIDGLRGLLALGVFFHHYVTTYFFFVTNEWKVPPSRFYTLIGQVGVAIFFMITGFLFWHKLRTSTEAINWTALYRARFFRIVPLFWFVVFVVVMIVLCVSRFSIHTTVDMLAAQIAQWMLFFWMPDINNFKGTGRITAFVQWTLAYEWIFYFSLPFLAAAIRWSRTTPSVLWLVGGVVVIGAIYPVAIPFIGMKLYSDLFLYFLIGAVAASAYSNEAIKSWAQRTRTAGIALVSLTLVFLLFDEGYGLMPAIFLAIFFFPIALGNSIFGLLKSPALILLGHLSYSIYLLHGLIIYILFSLLFPTFFSSTTSAFWINAAMPVVATLLVGISYLTYSHIEQPFIRIGQSCQNKHKR